MKRFIGTCKGKDLKEAMTKAALEASLNEENAVIIQAKFNHKTGEGFTEVRGETRGIKTALMILIEELAREAGETVEELLLQFMAANEAMETIENIARRRQND